MSENWRFPLYPACDVGSFDPHFTTILFQVAPRLPDSRTGMRFGRPSGMTLELKRVLDSLAIGEQKR